MASRDLHVERMIAHQLNGRVAVGVPTGRYLPAASGVSSE